MLLMELDCLCIAKRLGCPVLVSYNLNVDQDLAKLLLEKKLLELLLEDRESHLEEA